MRNAVLVALLIAGPLWWFWGRTLAPERVIDAHLQAISQHDYERAYHYLSRDAKARLSLEDFTEQVRSNTILQTHYTSDFLSRKIDGNQAVFSGNVRALGSEKIPATFVLVKAGEQWFIREFRY